ncbi:MAG: formylglycine-generating enzyme family protein, partial [Alphaproteobacteria bacterium]|nr:formylglycine-generating enzyme family protein [Alphaproteobacteria bacterium]
MKRSTLGLWATAMLVVLSILPAGGQQLAGEKDCATCPALLRVPPGTFVMGAAEGEKEREGVPPPFRGRSVPQHEVAVAAFRMGRTPVTRDEFAAFVAATKRDLGGACRGLGTDGQFREAPGRDWRNPGFAQTGTHPVVCVSWLDALAYVDWLSGTTGKAYRLPSEAQWEYVARAGTQTARFWGDGRDGA